MEVWGYSTGRVRAKRGQRGARRYLPGGWADETLPVNAFAIEHPAGVLLFDTGQTTLAGRRGYLTPWHPFMWLSRFELGPEDEVVPQLKKLGLDPAAVRWVVLSHLHTDHVGGLDAFRNTDVIVSRTEWELAQGTAGRIRGYLPQHWPTGLVPRLVEMAGPAIGPFTGSFDIAGDGKLMLLAAPGHTRGHVALLVRADVRTFLLAGDLAHTAEQLAYVAPDIANFCRDEDIVVLAAHDDSALDIVRHP